MSEEQISELSIDESKLLSQLQRIEDKRKEVDQAVEQTGKKTRETWQLAVGVAQASWTLLDSIISASGETTGIVTRTIIQSAFSAINILTPLLTAASVTPGMQLTAAFGFTQLAFALAAAGQAQATANQANEQLQQQSQVISKMRSFIGVFNF